MRKGKRSIFQRPGLRLKTAPASAQPRLEEARRSGVDTQSRMHALFAHDDGHPGFAFTHSTRHVLEEKAENAQKVQP